jgi:NTP pyrophosphatase (non-canonical NTP hydrolase)
MKPKQLWDLFKIQADVMKMLGVDEGAQYSPSVSLAAFEAAAGIASEAGEVLDAIATSTKPWKAKSEHEVRMHVLEELTDVLFFTFELYILMFGKDPILLMRQFAHKAIILKARVLSSKFSRAEIADAVHRTNIGGGFVEKQEASTELFTLVKDIGEDVPTIFSSVSVFADDPRSFVKNYFNS